MTMTEQDLDARIQRQINAAYYRNLIGGLIGIVIGGVISLMLWR